MLLLIVYQSSASSKDLEEWVTAHGEF